MKSIISFVLIVGSIYSFSFRKMEESGVFICDNNVQNNYNFVSKINEIEFNDLRNSLPLDNSKRYFAYIFDKFSGYGLSTNIQKYRKKSCTSKQITLDLARITFNIFQNTKYEDLKEFKIFIRIMLNSICLLKDLTPKAFFLDFDKKSKGFVNINELIETNRESKNDFLHEHYIENFKWKKKYISVSKIKVMNTVKGVKLSKTIEDKTKKVIDFQKSLKNYIRKHNYNSFGESLFQPVLKLKTAFENKVEVPLLKEIIDKSEVIFTDQEKELLENSEILAVWHLAPTTYSTKEYKDREKELDLSKEVPDYKSKIVNRILIGWAIDKRNNTTFHWVTDLGTDIEVLFDEQYAFVISKKVN